MQTGDASGFRSNTHTHITSLHSALEKKERQDGWPNTFSAEPNQSHFPSLEKEKEGRGSYSAPQGCPVSCSLGNVHLRGALVPSNT